MRNCQEKQSCFLTSMMIVTTIRQKRLLKAEVSALKKEVEKQKCDNKRLRVLRAVNKDLPVIGDQLKQIRENLTYILKQTARTAEDSNKQIIIEDYHYRIDDKGSENVQYVANTKEEVEVNNAAVNVDEIQDFIFTDEDNKDNNINKMIFQELQTPATGDNHMKKEKIVDEGQKVDLKPEILEKCNHANVAKLTGDLTSALFSRKELATSSLTGKVANIHKNKNTAGSKEKLSPRRVNAIMSYVQSRFTSSQETIKEIQQTIRRKCNNARLPQ